MRHEARSSNERGAGPVEAAADRGAAGTGHEAFGDLQVDHPRTMKDVERKNAPLHWLVARRRLDKQVLAEIVSGNE